MNAVMAWMSAFLLFCFLFLAMASSMYDCIAARVYAKALRITRVVTAVFVTAFPPNS
jgi:hypothetical protein